MVINLARTSGLCLSSAVLLKQRQEKIQDTIFMKACPFYNVSHFDRKCCERHLSFSLNRFIQTHQLTIVNND